MAGFPFYLVWTKSCKLQGFQRPYVYHFIIGICPTLVGGSQGILAGSLSLGNQALLLLTV